MTKHLMTMAYQPKIEAVCTGVCRQTIRKGRKFTVGDEVLIHPTGNSCKECEWWLCVKVRAAVNLLIDASDSFAFGIMMLPTAWDGEHADTLAMNDFIDPPAGLELREVLFGFYGIPDGSTEYQIVRW